MRALRRAGASAAARHSSHHLLLPRSAHTPSSALPGASAAAQQQLRPASLSSTPHAAIPPQDPTTTPQPPLPPPPHTEMCGRADLGIRQSIGEPSSYSNAKEVAVRHMSFAWEVSFAATQITGTTALSVEALKDGASSVVLDTRDLEILSVTRNGAPLAFALGESSEAFGTALTVTLAAPLKAGESAVLTVSHRTSAACTALSWLTASQTVGGAHPYLFSQCQAIHARSLFPCQDTPGTRATYDAAITAPAELAVCMSALQDGEPAVGGDGATKVTRFRQPVAIASYLVALVVGNLERREVSERVAVWSEPEVVATAAYDFADTEKVVAIGERLAGPYVWGRYDVVSLPGSFPYGGMENPCLTFVSPTIVTGDRSLFSVVAHEVAHSWTGNLVGPETWEDFFLNEGFTMFLERRIMSELYGKDYFDFSAGEGGDILKETVEELGATHPFTALRPDLKGVDPDDSFSSIPYEKGFAFICYLRSVVGSNTEFDAWLLSYIQTFKHKMITTEDMIGHMQAYFTEGGEGGRFVDFSKIDWVAWLDRPGMPPVLVSDSVVPVLLTQCKELAGKWQALCGGAAVEGLSEGDLKGWTSVQICRFLNLFKESVNGKVPVDVLTKLDKLYGFNSTKNSEQLFLWLKLCITNGWTGHEKVLLEFLSRVGRMKFTIPLYTLMKAKDPAWAKEVFLQNKDSYHPIASKMIGKVVL